MATPEPPETNGTRRRRVPALQRPPPVVAVQQDDASTGLPGLRTWRGVYFTVGGIFVLWVALLTALTFLYAS